MQMLYPLYSYANYNARLSVPEIWNPRLIPNRRNPKATTIAYAYNNIKYTDLIKDLFKHLPDTMLSEPQEEEELASLNLEDQPEHRKKEEEEKSEPNRRKHLINEFKTVKPTLDWLDRIYFNLKFHRYVNL